MDAMTQTSDALAIAAETPVAVLSSREKFDALLGSIRKMIDEHQPDTSTVKGRREIASLAHRIAQTKVAIDDAGKKLNEEARARINEVDRVRREIRDRLDGMRDDARRPLDEWERQEVDRQAQIDAAALALERLAVVLRDATSADVQAQIDAANAMVFPEIVFRDRQPAMEGRRNQVVAALREAAERIQREEADRAELARLRAETEAREAEQRRQREEAEAAERERTIRERAEQEREARERAAAERAAEAARREAEAKHQAELTRLQRERDAAQAERDAELRRQKAEAEAQRAREADRAHRGAVMKAAKEALMEHAGLNEEAAKRVVLAITGGHVPAVRVAF